MYRRAAAGVLLLLVFPGCRTTHRVAAGTARVVTAPAHFVGRRIRGNDRETGQDQVYDAQPVAELPPPPTPVVRSAPPPAPPRQRPETALVSRPSPTPSTPPPLPSPRSVPSTAPEFPVAKAVPGKPGYVYSPFDGTMIDVTGFTSGAKAKDPGNNKIFIVP